MAAKNWPRDQEEYFWKELMPHYDSQKDAAPRYTIADLERMIKEKFPETDYRQHDIKQHHLDGTMGYLKCTDLTQSYKSIGKSRAITPEAFELVMDENGDPVRDENGKAVFWDPSTRTICS